MFFSCTKYGDVVKNVHHHTGITQDKNIQFIPLPLRHKCTLLVFHFRHICILSNQFYSFLLYPLGTLFFPSKEKSDHSFLVFLLSCIYVRHMNTISRKTSFCINPFLVFRVKSTLC